MSITESTTTTYCPGTPDDSYAVFAVFEETLADLNLRLGSSVPTSAADPGGLARMWAKRRTLYEHLAREASEYWLAKQEGRVIGFSRSTLRDGLRQLTELFVLPGEQSGGVGRELMARSFPANGARRRSIIASADYRAQALYLRAGMRPRFPIYYLGRRPEHLPYQTDLTIEPLVKSQDTLATIASLDEMLLGFRRDPDHAWLLAARQGYLYLRSGEPVGYGYVGQQSGPFALLESSDYPAVLAHAESEAAAQGRNEFGLEVPTVNAAAMDHLISRGYRLDSFIAMLMSDEPFGRFENYVVTSPPFFL